MSGSAPKLKSSLYKGMSYFDEIYRKVSHSPLSNGREFSESNRHCLSAMVCTALFATPMRMYSNNVAILDYLPVADMLLCTAFEAAMLLLTKPHLVKARCEALRNNHACVQPSIPRSHELTLINYIRIAAAFSSPAMRSAIQDALEGFGFVDVVQWVALPQTEQIVAVFKDKGAVLAAVDEDLAKRKYRQLVECVQGVPGYLIEDYLSGSISRKTLCILDQWPEAIPKVWQSAATSSRVAAVLHDVVRYKLGHQCKGSRP